MKIERIRNLLSSVLVAAIVVSTAIGQALPSSFSGKRVKRIVVRNAMVVDGSGKPAAGPLDIYVENDVIKRIVGSPATRPSASNADELVIDSTGKYVLPGLINLHGHTQDERAGVPMPVEYVTKMWLACGITTVRDAWADPKILGYRDQINAGIAPVDTLLCRPVGIGPDIAVDVAVGCLVAQVAENQLLEVRAFLAL